MTDLTPRCGWPPISELLGSSAAQMLGERLLRLAPDF